MGSYLLKGYVDTWLTSAAPGEALSTVWYVEQTAHPASVRKSDMSLGPTVSAMSYSVVQSIVMITWCIRSNIPLAWVLGDITPWSSASPLHPANNPFHLLCVNLEQNQSCNHHSCQEEQNELQVAKLSFFEVQQHITAVCWPGQHQGITTAKLVILACASIFGCNNSKSWSFLLWSIVF